MSGVDDQINWIDCSCGKVNQHWIGYLTSGLAWLLNPTYILTSRDENGHNYPSGVVCSRDNRNNLLQKNINILKEITSFKCHGCLKSYLPHRSDLFKRILMTMKFEALKNGIACYGLDEVVRYERD